MVESVSLEEKFGMFSEHWKPKIVAEVNDSYVKIAKVSGEFVWHRHPEEDELFLVLKGRLTIRLRDRDVSLKEGELAVVPRGVEHMPFAEGEARLMLIEPKSTVNTGDESNERTAAAEWV